MRVFIPVEDAPSGALAALLVPYQCGLVCEHALSEEWAPEEHASGSRNDGNRNRQYGLADHAPVHGYEAA